MPRKPRLFVAGGYYHVVLRGNGRADISFEGSDRQKWQSLLQKGLDRYGHRLHAYCWMTNHVHLLWSSHHAYVGLEKPPWLTTEFVLGCFGPTIRAARTAYLRFVQGGQSTA